MEQKKILALTLTLDVVFAGAAIFLYQDRTAQRDLLAQLTNERNEAIAASGELEGEVKKLKGRLALLENGVEVDEGAAELLRLRESVDEKDAEISRLKRELENAAAKGGEERRSDRRQQPNMEDMRKRHEERMARMKEEDPERYERMQAERERMETQRKERLAQRDQYLAGLNVGNLTDKQRDAINTYQSLIKANEELRANMEEGNGMESMREMMRNQMQIGRMSAEVQDILIEQYANGVSSGNGSAVAEEIRSIINATSPMMPGPPGGGPGRGGMGPGF